MKLTEIMIIRNINNEPRLKTLLVDDSTIARLIRIRGNLYKDDPRLRTVADMPTLQQPQTPDPVYSQAAIESAEKAVALYKMMNEAGERTKAAMQPQPERPKTPEEIWRYSPELRAEFGGNLASYQAYMRAAESGRCRG